MSSMQPRLLEPNFQKKPKRWWKEDNGTAIYGVERKNYCGYLNLDENVVVVEDAASVISLGRPGSCYGKLFPQPYSRRIKGTICVSEDPIPTADEFKSECAAKLRIERERHQREEIKEPSFPDREAEGPQSVMEKPSRVVEPRKLKLTPEEALYLLHDRQILSIYRDPVNKIAFSIDEFFDHCWRSVGASKFPIRYAAYRYYRSKGWVVRDGESYGVTYVLYKSHPADYHSTYGVLVQSSSKSINWRKIAGLSRALITVSKELLICTVDPGSADPITLSDLGQLAIKEMHLKSWFARQNQERTELEAKNSSTDLKKSRKIVNIVCDYATEGEKV